MSNSDEEAVKNCKRIRLFKEYFLFSKFNSEWKDLSSYFSRCVEVQNYVINNIIKTSIKDHYLFGQNRMILNYYLFRGFNLSEAKQKLAEFQSVNSKKFRSKYSKEEMKKFTNTCIEYYLERGFSQEESIKLLNERQSTFSLDKLINKYGEEKAIEMMNDRNTRWQQSLNENNNMEDVNKRKDSASLEYFIAKNGDTDETREKYRVSCYNLGSSSRGKLRSVENRLNISKGIRRYYQNRRNTEGTDYSGIVYFLHFKEHNAVKIGITGSKSNRFESLEKTFGQFEVIHLIETSFCFRTETCYHNMFEQYSTPLNKIRTNGFTEFFSEEIIHLINSNIKLKSESK